MRLLFFNEGNLGSYILGQAQLERSLRRHAGGADGIEVRFANLTPQGRLAHALATRPVPGTARLGVELGGGRWYAVQALRARAALERELRGGRPDVVHVHSHSVALGMVGLMRRVPTALSVDATTGDWSAMPAWRRTDRVAVLEQRASRAVEARALGHAALVLAWTRWTRRGVERLAPHARVVEHHPGLDLTAYSPGAREPRALPRVLFVGGRFEDKGGEDLLAALGDDLGRTVEVDAVTPADVAPRPGLRVHRLGPNDPELLELRRQADLFCLPSKADAIPWALLEAMACGTPVVGSDVGGIPDLVGDAGGVVVGAGDRTALRAALLSLLGDEPRRAALGASARARCEEHFDAAVRGPELVRLLAGLGAPA